MRAYTLVVLPGLIWLLAACGRFGVERLSGVKDASVDRDSAIDAGHSDRDAGYVNRDAGHSDASPPCPMPCANEHGTADCSTGSCEIHCEIGYADCDGMVSNGCETATSDNLLSCGACDLQCTTAQGVTACEQGVCSPSCIAGTSGDCDGNTQNGCEATLNDNVAACGACGRTCSNAHGTTLCEAGACVPTCAAGYEDCDGDQNNGCETSIATDPLNCGSCGETCDTSFQVCGSASCQVSMCPQGAGDCDSASSDCETDLTTALDHCGFCDNACSLAHATARCDAASCAIDTCDASFDDCDATAANGCETVLLSDAENCGGCGELCSNAHGSTSCSSGTCAPICSSGWGSCDANPQNGCETALDTPAHCGTCGTVCPNAMAGATGVCSGGVCGYVCNSSSGVYALRLNAQVSWPAKDYIRAGSGTVRFWFRLTITQSGTMLMGQAQLCDQETPETRNSVTSDRYLLSYPSAVFTPGGPAAAFSATLASLAPGAGLSSTRAVHLLGATMPDPLNGVWPSLSTLRTNQVDHDGDGEVGMTSLFVDDATYNHAQTSGSLVAARASASYGAQRVRFSLAGALTGCSGASGTATVQSFDTKNIGCRLESNQDCNSSQYTHIDSNAAVYSVSSATYNMVKLGNPGSSFTCAQVRGAL